MLGLLGIGVALIAGIALRLAAGAGVLIMAMMWLGEYPLAQHTSAGAPSASTNPITDYHFIYAVVLVVLAAAYAGHRWGLGRVWARLPFVQSHRVVGLSEPAHRDSPVRSQVSAAEPRPRTHLRRHQVCGSDSDVPD